MEDFVRDVIMAQIDENLYGLYGSMRKKKES